MKCVSVALLTVALCLGLATSSIAADTATQTVTMNVDEVCLIDVTGNPGTLTIVAPGTGGQSPSNQSDNSTYAQYTSVVSGVTTRTVTAEWGATDAAPSGCSLKLEVTSLTSGCGTAGSQITVSSTAQNIITAISSCATGTAATDGGQLTYTLSVDDVTQLDHSDDQSATITLTLTDAS